MGWYPVFLANFDIPTTCVICEGILLIILKSCCSNVLNCLHRGLPCSNSHVSGSGLQEHREVVQSGARRMMQHFLLAVDSVLDCRRVQRYPPHDDGLLLILSTLHCTLCLFRP